MKAVLVLHDGYEKWPAEFARLLLDVFAAELRNVRVGPPVSSVLATIFGEAANRAQVE
ncbi:hypothetical protein ACFTTN_28675 [Streptomyces niveus]|uniref:hypothetical protein n=1 Tax=Streptomyces niveus TaxID=193462 RepID=UPI00363A139D